MTRQNARVANGAFTARPFEAKAAVAGRAGASVDTGAPSTFETPARHRAPDAPGVDRFAVIPSCFIVVASRQPALPPDPPQGVRVRAACDADDLTATA